MIINKNGNTKVKFLYNSTSMDPWDTDPIPVFTGDLFSFRGAGTGILDLEVFRIEVVCKYILFSASRHKCKGGD